MSQQPHGQQDFPQAQQSLRQYGPATQDPQPPHTGQQNGHRAEASWPSRHKVLTGAIAVAALFIAGGIGAAAWKGSGSTASPAPTVTVTQTQQVPGPAATVTATPPVNAQGEATQIRVSGVYVFGQDIESGTWHASGNPTTWNCYFATLNSTATSDISDNNNFTGRETVYVSGAKAFEIGGDCSWQHEG